MAKTAVTAVGVVAATDWRFESSRGHQAVAIRTHPKKKHSGGLSLTAEVGGQSLRQDGEIRSNRGR